MLRVTAVKYAVELFFRIALFALALFLMKWAIETPLPDVMNLSIILGGVLLVFPVVWLGRKILDRHPTKSSAVWITTFIQFAVANLLGLGAIRAATTHRNWPDWALP